MFANDVHPLIFVHTQVNRNKQSCFFLPKVATAWEKARRKILEVVNDLLRTLLTLHFKIIKILKLTLICSLLFFGEIYIPPSISAFFHYPEEQEGSERGVKGFCPPPSIFESM